MDNQDYDEKNKQDDGGHKNDPSIHSGPPIINTPQLQRNPQKVLAFGLIILILLGYFTPKAFISRLPFEIRPQRHPSSLLLPFEFDSVPGFFIQDNPLQDPNPFEVYHPNSSFGLIDNSSKDRWIAFQSKIKQLIDHRPHGVDYKVIFIARHGQGFHNVAESKYGTPLWNCYWSEETTDGDLVWGPDARLTRLGRSEARVAQKAWDRELQSHAPLPELFILSPLSRSIETMMITGVWKHYRSKPRPIILVQEQWRENIGLHTCDQRRSKHDISKDFGKMIEFEEGFTDLDLLWTPSLQETDKQLDNRIRGALTSIFVNPISSNRTYLSITAHSGVISSLLRVIGHQPWPTETGGMIPLVIRARLKKSPTQPPNPGPSATRPSCLGRSY